MTAGTQIWWIFIFRRGNKKLGQTTTTESATASFAFVEKESWWRPSEKSALSLDDDAVDEGPKILNFASTATT